VGLPAWLRATSRLARQFRSLAKGMCEPACTPLHDRRMGFANASIATRWVVPVQWMRSLMSSAAWCSACASAPY